MNKNKNSGYLFINKKKTGNQPDYRGKIKIDGKEYWLSGWETDKDGEKMWSLSATDPSTIQNNNQAQNNAQHNEPAKSDPQPENKKSNNSDGIPDSDFFSDIFDIPN